MFFSQSKSLSPKIEYNGNGLQIQVLKFKQHIIIISIFNQKKKIDALNFQ